MSKLCIGFIGFGEAASAFTTGWNAAGMDVAVTSFDIIAKKGNCASRQHALQGCPVIFSLVTADQANLAIVESAPYIPEGALVFDGNSCAPDTKRLNAQRVEQLGGRYVDLAIMAPVHPGLHQTPLLVSGDHAAAGLDILQNLGMSANIIDGDIGAASAIKMIRSIMIKGLEALTMECVLAGRQAGVEETVLQSLNASFPGFDWSKRAEYMMERVTTHGTRRAAEMREVVKTVEQLGLPADMAAATVEWQARIGALGIHNNSNIQTVADDIIKEIKP